jgi:hypothetical protein
MRKKKRKQPCRRILCIESFALDGDFRLRKIRTSPSTAVQPRPLRVRWSRENQIYETYSSLFEIHDKDICPCPAFRYGQE